MLNNFSTKLINHRYALLILTLGLTVGLSYGVVNLKLNSDTRAYFKGDNPQLKALDELEATYSKDDIIRIVIAPKNGNIFSRRVLGLIEDLTESAWRTPYVKRVDSLINFQYSRADGDEILISDLVENAHLLSSEELKEIEAAALSEPRLKNTLLSQDGRVSAIAVTVQLPGKSMDEVPESVAFVRNILAEAAADYGDIDFPLSGTLMLNNAFAETSKKDLRTLYPLMITVILISLIAVLRSIWITAIVLLIVILSSIGAMGAIGWYAIEIAPNVIAAPVMIMTLAIADCVHIVTTYHRLRDTGIAKLEAIRQSIVKNFYPVALTSVTTAIGFLTLNFSDSPPFKILGNLVAIGVVLAFVLAVLVLPAFLALLPDGYVKQRKPDGHFRLFKLSNGILKNHRRVFIGGIIAALSMSLLIPLNQVNDNPVEFFDHSLKIRRDTEYVNDHLTGTTRINYSVPSHAKNGISDMAYLHKLDEFALWLRQQPGVVHVSVLTDILKKLNQNMHNDDPHMYRLPESEELAAQYILLYEMSLPYGLDLTNTVNMDKTASRLIVVMKKASNKDIFSHQAKVENWFKNKAPAMRSTGISRGVMFAHLSNTNVKSLLLGVSIGLLIISLILMVALKSIRLGFVSLICNIAPTAMAFGLWGASVGTIGLGVSVVMGMTLGIVVDNTVHLLSKYKRARLASDKSTKEALRHALTTVGSAVIATNLVLIAGFLVLTFSTFSNNSEMGLLTAVALALALLFHLSFLPALVIQMDRRPILTPPIPASATATD